MLNPVTKLEKDQFAVSLGELININKTAVSIHDKTGGVYSLSVEIEFACKKEFIQGGNNDLDPRMGSLAVLLTGIKRSIDIQTPDVIISADQNNATIMSLLLKIPDGVKGNHD